MLVTLTGLIWWGGGNGALSLAAGTFRLSCSLLITSLSTASGSAKFDFKGAGSAIFGMMSMQDFGSRGTVAVGGNTATSGTASDVPASGGALSAAATLCRPARLDPRHILDHHCRHDHFLHRLCCRSRHRRYCGQLFRMHLSRAHRRAGRQLTKGRKLHPQMREFRKRIADILYDYSIVGEALLFMKTPRNDLSELRAIHDAVMNRDAALARALIKANNLKTVDIILSGSPQRF